jgi:hypothetical protein
MYVGDWRFNCATDVVANIQERVLVLEERGTLTQSLFNNNARSFGASDHQEIVYNFTMILL